MEKADISNILVEEINIGFGDVNPVVVDEFLDCDVVLDADQTLADIQNSDDLDTFNIVIGNSQIPQAEQVVNIEVSTAPAAPAVQAVTEMDTNSGVLSELPVAALAALAAPAMQNVDQTTVDTKFVIEVVTDQHVAESPDNQKRRRGSIHDLDNDVPMDTSASLTRCVVIALSASASTPPAPKSFRDIVDEDGFTNVVHRKSPKMASRPAIVRHLK